MLSHGFPSWLKARAHEGKVALFFILASGFALRLFWVLHAQTQPVEIADPQWYYAVASNLAAGHGFTVRIVGNEWAAGAGGSPTTLWPPGWPLSLTALFVIFGTGLTVAKLLNVVAGVVTIYLAYRIGELSFGRRIGLIGAAILAFYPSHIFWSSTLYADVYFTMWFS
ncbi:MAG TPA: glycosyltransferase family 39 protein, partial [Dehalococcoidia bacterium]|nr:glycosyltransferase family 39 protein [Dehalococcoidia bacterium]